MCEINYMPDKLSGLEFCLALGCPLNCHYCPQNLLKERYAHLYGGEKIMSFSTFKACLSQVINGCGVTFCGMVEPFVNPDCAKMIRYAYDEGYKVTLFTTLFGMNLRDVDLLEGITFEELIIHIPDCEGNMKLKITDEYKMVLKAVHEKLNVTGYSCHGTVREEIRDQVKEDLMMATKLSDRAGNLKDTEYLPTMNKGKLMCKVGLSTKGVGGWVPTVLPNGSLALCCMDYGLKHPLGNLLNQSYEEIVSGEEFQKFLNGLCDENADTLCRTCSSAINRSEMVLDLNIRALNMICVAKTMMNSQERERYEILKKLKDAEHICVFGLGHLFSDSYHKSSWDRLIRADLLSDNDSEKWGKKFNGIVCVPPKTLSDYRNLLVIIYVKEADEIENQLKQIGVTNTVKIYDLYNVLS